MDAEFNDSEQTVNDYLEGNENFKANTKKDAGATQFKKSNNNRRVPLHKVTLETPVPDEPQEKHDPPNEKQCTKDLELIEKDIKKHEASVIELKDKVNKEIAGDNPELNKLYNEQKKLREEIAALDANLAEIEKKIGEPALREKKLKEQRTALEKEIDYKDYEKLNNMILGLQNDLGFGQLTASEEKKKMALKEKLETQVIKTKKYQGIRDEIKVLQATNKPLFDQLALSRKEIGIKYSKVKENKIKIDELKKNHKENATVVEQLKIQIKNINEEIKRLTKEYYTKENEYYDKLKKYEKYKEFMDYIAEFKKIQHEIKKKEEKQKKREEKENKKNQKTSETVEINIVKSEETVEEAVCKDLIEFFKSLLPKTEAKTEIKEVKAVVSDKIAEDLKKGNVSVFDRDAENSSQVLGIAGGNKKKDKGPKVSKREQKSNSAELLLLSVGILKQIKEIGLTAPNKRDQVETFINTIEKRREEFKQASSKVKEQLNKETPSI